MKVKSSYTRLPPHPLDADPIAKEAALDAFVDESRRKAEREFIKKYAKEGGQLGFKIGCAATVWGIPLATTYAQTQGKGREARKAKKRIRLWRIVCAPTTLVGGLGYIIGAVVGAATATVKISKKNKALHG